MSASRPWGEADDVRCAEWLQRRDINVSPKVVARSIGAVAHGVRVHPVREYLSNLTWDGIRRMETWAITYLGAADTGIPYAYLSNDVVKANYSNSRMALLEFRRRVDAWQHSVMVHQMCRKVWQRWLDVAVLSGALDIPGYERNRAAFIACSWLPPKWDWVDPLKDAKAEIEQIDAGLKSRTRALAERGYDAEQVDAEIAADREREQRLGLTFGATPSPLPGRDAPIQTGP